VRGLFILVTIFLSIDCSNGKETGQTISLPGYLKGDWEVEIESLDLGEPTPMESISQSKIHLHKTSTDQESDTVFTGLFTTDEFYYDIEFVLTNAVEGSLFVSAGREPKDESDQEGDQEGGHEGGHEGDHESDHEGGHEGEEDENEADGEDHEEEGEEETKNAGPDAPSSSSTTTTTTATATTEGSDEEELQLTTTFRVVTRPNGAFFTQGFWKNTHRYEAVIMNYNSFVITCTLLSNPKQVINVFGKRTGSDAPKGFMEKYRSWIMLLGFFLLSRYISAKTKRMGS